MTTLYAAHQPDLLPYSGFWYKMAKADLFDLKIWDQYVHKGYQRRVPMRGSWVSMPLVKGEVEDPISAKRLTEKSASHLADAIVKRYTHSFRKPPFWDLRGPQICDEILSIRTDLLWQFNFQLILLVRSILGIDTPITFSRPVPPGVRGSAGIISVIGAFKGPIDYLSGVGGRSYMGDCREFADVGIGVIWSRHRPVTGDSILSLLFDYEDPLSVVLEEQPEETARPIASAGAGAGVANVLQEVSA